MADEHLGAVKDRKKDPVIGAAVTGPDHDIAGRTGQSCSGGQPGDLRIKEFDSVDGRCDNGKITCCDLRSICRKGPNRNFRVKEIEIFQGRCSHKRSVGPYAHIKPRSRGSRQKHPTGGCAVAIKNLHI